MTQKPLLSLLLVLWALASVESAPLPQPRSCDGPAAQCTVSRGRARPNGNLVQLAALSLKKKRSPEPSDVLLSAQVVQLEPRKIRESTRVRLGRRDSTQAPLPEAAANGGLTDDEGDDDQDPGVALRKRQQNRGGNRNGGNRGRGRGRGNGNGTDTGNSGNSGTDTDGGRRRVRKRSPSAVVAIIDEDLTPAELQKRQTRGRGRGRNGRSGRSRSRSRSGSRGGRGNRSD